MDFSKAFNHERDIPYCIALHPGESNNSCAGKNLRLLALLREKGMEARQRICWFHWSDLPLPKEVLDLPHDDEATHLYLEMKYGDSWMAIDASWDAGIASVLPVNTWEEGRSMTIAVPASRTLSPEESDAYMQSLNGQDAEDDLKKNSSFYLAINRWLDAVRIK